MSIAATSQAEAEDIARKDGHSVYRKGMDWKDAWLFVHDQFRMALQDPNWTHEIFITPDLGDGKGQKYCICFLLTDMREIGMIGLDLEDKMTKYIILELNGDAWLAKFTAEGAMVRANFALTMSQLDAPI